MTKAILTLEGMERLEGTAEMGGDYVRLLVETRKETADFSPATRGQIEVEGKASDVVLENASMAIDRNDGVVLTMRLLKPLG